MIMIMTMMMVRVFDWEQNGAAVTYIDSDIVTLVTWHSLQGQSACAPLFTAGWENAGKAGRMPERQGEYRKGRENTGKAGRMPERPRECRKGRENAGKAGRMPERQGEKGIGQGRAEGLQALSYENRKRMKCQWPWIRQIVMPGRG